MAPKRAPLPKPNNGPRTRAGNRSDNAANANPPHPPVAPEQPSAAPVNNPPNTPPVSQALPPNTGPRLQHGDSGEAAINDIINDAKLQLAVLSKRISALEAENRFLRMGGGRAAGDVENLAGSTSMPTGPTSMAPIDLSGEDGSSGRKRYKHTLIDIKAKFPKFSGKEEEDYEVWYEDVEAFFRQYDLSAEDKIAMMDANLTGMARHAVHGVSLASLKTVAAVNAYLKGIFSDRVNWYNKFENCKQGATEKVKAYAVRLETAARRCGHQGATLDQMCVTHFRRHTRPEFVALLQSCLPNTDFDTAIDHAVAFEQDVQGDEKKKSAKRPFELMKTSEVDEYTCETKKMREEYINGLKTLTDKLNSLKSQMKPGSQSNRLTACFHCGIAGHRFTECRKATEQDKSKISGLLQARKFNFDEFRAKAQRVEVEREQKRSLNSKSTTSSSTPSL
jgi:hypothetical protein